MAEALRRGEPVPAGTIEFVGAKIALEPPMARYSLRARDAGSLDKVFGRSMPRTIGEIAQGSICLGPDEWLLRLPVGEAAPDSAGQPVSVVEISERQIALSVEGARAVDVVLAGSPLDIERFPVGTGRRTIFEGVEIVLIRESETRFVIEVWRSFAEFVWGVLTKAGSEL